MTKKYTIKKLTIGVLSVGLALVGLQGSVKEANAENIIVAKTSMQDVTVSVAEVDGKAVATVKATKDVKNVEILMTINGVTKIYTVGDLKTDEIATVEELLVKSEVKTLPKTSAAKEVKQLVNKKEVVEGVLSGHTVKVTVKYQVEELVKVEGTVKTETDTKDKDAKLETGGTYSPKDVIKPENIDKPSPKDNVKPLPPTIEDLELPKPKPEQPKGDNTVKPETGGTYSPKDVIKPENIDKPKSKDEGVVKPNVETPKDSGKVDAYQPKGEGVPVPSKPETGGTYSPKDVIKPENIDKPESKDEGVVKPSVETPKPETGGTYSPKDVIKPENIDKPTPKDDVKPLPPTIEDLELPKPKPEQPKGEETPKTDDEKLVDEINKENEKEKDKDKEVLPEKPKDVETPEVTQPEGEKPSVDTPKTEDTVKPETGDTVKPEGDKPSTEVTPERTPVYGDADYNWQPTYKNLDKNEPFELYAKYDLLEFNKSVVKYINQYAKPEEKLASGAIEPTVLSSENVNNLHRYSFRAYELARQVGSTTVKGEAHVRPEGPDNKMIGGENTLEMTDISRPGTGNDFRGVEDKLAHMAVVAWDQSEGHKAAMERGDRFKTAFDYNPYTGRIIVTMSIN